MQEKERREAGGVPPHKIQPRKSWISNEPLDLKQRANEASIKLQAAAQQATNLMMKLGLNGLDEIVEEEPRSGHGANQYKEYLTSKKAATQLTEELRNLKADMQRSVRRDRAKYLQEVAEECMQDNKKGNIRAVYKYVKDARRPFLKANVNLEKEDGTLAATPQDNADALAEHMENIFNMPSEAAENPWAECDEMKPECISEAEVSRGKAVYNGRRQDTSKKPIMTPETAQPLENEEDMTARGKDALRPPQLTEVNWAIRKLKNNKAGNGGRIIAEMLKYKGPEVEQAAAAIPHLF